MTNPIDSLLAQVEWQGLPGKVTEGDLPVATHSGVLDLMGSKLRVYRLSTGQAVINEDDLTEFLNECLGNP
jgi:hypothetical protein